MEASKYWISLPEPWTQWENCFMAAIGIIGVMAAVKLCEDYYNAFHDR